jgi:tetratricopeptide (TPR) repeat protein
LNNCFKSLLVVLLVSPVSGAGQQGPASRLESLVATAQQAQAAHDYAAAENAYGQAVRIEPQMPELWANLGLVEQQAGDIPAAVKSFLTANHLNPSLYVPNLFLGVDDLRFHKAQEATSFLSKAEKINKADPQAPLALGRAYFATGKFTAAAREFERATTLDPRLGDAWFALGIARLNQVESDARKMSMANGDSPFAGALYAESLEKQARFGEAATLYRSLLASYPQPPCMHSGLGFALLRHRDAEDAATEFAAERTAHPECGLAILGQARMAIERGDGEHAAELLQGLWARDHGFVVSNIAFLIEGLSSDAAANVAGYFSQQSAVIPMDLRSVLLAAFNGSGQTLADNPDSRESSATLSTETDSAVRKSAEAYYKAGNFALCAERFDSEVTAQRADKLSLLAACAFFAGDNERASGAAAAMETVQPHSPEALYWSIQANQRLALKSLARFQQLESDSARSHVLLGDIYDQLERFDDAQSEYSKALSVAPGDPAALVGLASASLNNNNIEKAMETARLALKRNPQDAELNLIMAETLVAKEQFVQAEPYLMKSLTVKPQMVGHVHALIGKVYAETGRTRDAIDQLNMGLSSDENGSIHYLLARLYRQVGDTRDASAAIEQVKVIKQRGRDRGVKLVEDPDLSGLESRPGPTSTP